MGTIRCPSCGQALAKGASFCRTCGARYAAPAPQHPLAHPPVGEHAAVPGPAGWRRSRFAIATSAIIVALGAGAAAAIVLATGGGSSTTVVTRGVPAGPGSGAGSSAHAAGSVQAGRYVQAGSFQTASHAEAERQRLAAHGIDVEVVSSDEAKELYPGFQVLIGGPFRSRAAEAAMLTGLHRTGVPSAFGRGLTPAPWTGGAEVAAGSWSGGLERTSVERPGLDGLLPASLTVDADGTSGTLDLPTLRCQISLSLVDDEGHALSYDVAPSCAGTGPLLVRPSGDELMLTLRSPATDSFALGTLRRS